MVSNFPGVRVQQELLLVQRWCRDLVRLSGRSVLRRRQWCLRSGQCHDVWRTKLTTPTAQLMAWPASAEQYQRPVQRRQL